MRYKSGLLLHNNEITAPWGPDTLTELTVTDLSTLQQEPPELLIIGTGKNTAFPAREVLEWLDAQQIGFECMGTRAAARTYNILISEGRNVSAAMLLPSISN